MVDSPAEPALPAETANEFAPEDMVDTPPPEAPPDPTDQAISIDRLAAQRKIAMEEFDAGEGKRARDRLRMAIDRCGPSKCGPKSQAILWRDLGIVLASGVYDELSPMGAFKRALELNPETTIPPKYASPTVNAAFDAARGKSAPTIPPPVREPAPPTTPPPPTNEPWVDEPSNGDTKESAAKGTLGKIALSYAIGTGSMSVAYQGANGSALVIKQGAVLDLLFSLRPGNPKTALFGGQLRGGAYHAASSTGLVGSGHFGVSLSAGGAFGPSGEGIATFSFGLEILDSAPMAAIGARLGGLLGPLFLGFGVDVEAGGRDGMGVFGIQPLCYIGIGESL